VKTGDVLWKHDCKTEYSIVMPVWGISAAPLIYQDNVIVHIGGKKATIVAFDKASGREVWRALNERAQYSAPILVEQAGQPVVVCWTGDSIVGLNPATGAVHWRHELTPKKMPIGVATPVVQGDRLFVTSFYDGSLMLRLKPDALAVEQIWRRVGGSEDHTDALHSIISTPVILGDHIYGVDSYGELRCLKASDGERVWEDLTATPKNRWSTIHFVQNGDRTWMFNERGELIIAKLSPQGFQEISRAKLLKPTVQQLNRRGGVCWSHPAFAYGHVFARNDEELVCASLLTSDTPR
jgi:outer membrane protein assembly factor BamB